MTVIEHSKILPRIAKHYVRNIQPVLHFHGSRPMYQKDHSWKGNENVGLSTLHLVVFLKNISYPDLNVAVSLALILGIIVEYYPYHII